ncbi:hypothetical protein BDQ17DRAFT_1429580 [Cyathus striatus]|nr:hypothetical protein BDQ17DRAFT_1429580 [Cyathus striatus]
MPETSVSHYNFPQAHQQDNENNASENSDYASSLSIQPGSHIGTSDDHAMVSYNGYRQNHEPHDYSGHNGLVYHNSQYWLSQHQGENAYHRNVPHHTYPGDPRPAFRAIQKFRNTSNDPRTVTNIAGLDLSAFVKAGVPVDWMPSLHKQFMTTFMETGRDFYSEQDIQDANSYNVAGIGFHPEDRNYIVGNKQEECMKPCSD